MNNTEIQRYRNKEEREREGVRKGWLVNQCFEPIQPPRIMSGLKETFIKKYIIERTKKAEIRPEEPSEQMESCRGEFME